MQNQALEYFTLKASNAKSEDEILNVGQEMEAFNASGGLGRVGGGSVEGGAAAVTAARKSLLNDSQTRQTTRAQTLAGDVSENILNEALRDQEFDTIYGEDVANIYQLYESGDEKELRRLNKS